VLIYLTDGYGYFPDKEPDYPVIWLIDSEVEPPWGEKMQYEYDEKDKEKT
jgi:predicted metal-dependent peptidase